MISRYDVFLNGLALSAISPDLLVTDIQYTPVSFKNGGYTLANRQGTTIYKRYVDRSSVVVSFVLNTYSTQARHDIINSVIKWAKKGGILQTTDRNGQRFRCICEQFPNVTSAMNRIEELQITFAAHSLPFWESVSADSVSFSGTSGSGSLYVSGNVDGALVEASIKANAALSSVSLTANGKTMSLSGLSVASGQTILIAYDDYMVQSIKVGDTSLLNKRSGADDLLAKCGETNNFSFSSSAAVNVTFKVRGLWI